MSRDGISSKLLRETIDYFAQPLARIFNYSFISDTVCAHTHEISPSYSHIQDKQQHKSFNNYRPISIMPPFSKLLEQLIAKRLVNYLDRQNILYKHQYTQVCIFSNIFLTIMI